LGGVGGVGGGVPEAVGLGSVLVWFYLYSANCYCLRLEERGSEVKALRMRWCVRMVMII
jgi:hypothetical protein